MTAAALSSSRPRAAGSPWVVAAIVVVPTFMEVLDTTIAVVALPYIAGGLSATVDDGEWVLTSYLAANAVLVVALHRLIGIVRPHLNVLSPDGISVRSRPSTFMDGGARQQAMTSTMKDLQCTAGARQAPGSDIQHRQDHRGTESQLHMAPEQEQNCYAAAEERTVEAL